MNHQEKDGNQVPEKKRNFVSSVLVGLVGVVSAVYLINPGGGLIELIPDIVPVFGNLDEAGAAALLVSCLAYFGLDIGSIFGRFKKEEAPAEPRETKGEVIDS